MLLADLHLKYETPEQTKKGRRKSKKRELDRRQESYLKKHGH